MYKIYKKVRRFLRKLYYDYKYRSRVRRAEKPFRSKEERMKYLQDICDGKLRYRNRKQAWKASIRFKEKYGTETGVYKCWMCHRFHLTKKQDMNVPVKLKTKLYE